MKAGLSAATMLSSMAGSLPNAWGCFLSCGSYYENNEMH